MKIRIYSSVWVLALYLDATNMSLSRRFNKSKSLFDKVQYEQRVPNNSAVTLNLDKIYAGGDSQLLENVIQASTSNDTFTVHRERQTSEESIKNQNGTNPDETDDIKTTDTENIIMEADNDYQSMPSVLGNKFDGEPLKSQYLVIDFSPKDDEVDSEFNMNKCSEFWKFIDKHSELHHLETIPAVIEANQDLSSWKSTTTSVGTKLTKEHDVQDLTPITLLTLNWLKQENLMSDSLVTHRECPCEPVSNVYKEYCDKKQAQEVITMVSQEPKLIPKLPSVTRDTSSLVIKTQPVDDLALMMSEMEKWDLEHPKRMEPPTHAPSLLQPKMNLHKRAIPYIDKSEEKPNSLPAVYFN